MSISILLAEKIAQLFLILLMGYLVVRVGLLKPEDSRVLSVIMVYLVMPCMILNAFQIDNTPEVRTGIVYSFVVAGIMHLLFLALTALLKKPLKLDVIERCAVIYSNASALVIPLLQATLGSEYVVYSCGFIIVQLVLLWTHCCTVLRGDKGIDLKKIMTNLNLIAIVAAALLFAHHAAGGAGDDHLQRGQYDRPAGYAAGGYGNRVQPAEKAGAYAAVLFDRVFAFDFVPDGDAGVVMAAESADLDPRRQGDFDDSVFVRHYAGMFGVELDGAVV